VTVTLTGDFIPISRIQVVFLATQEYRLVAAKIQVVTAVSLNLKQVNLRDVLPNSSRCFGLRHIAIE